MANKLGIIQKAILLVAFALPIYFTFIYPPEFFDRFGLGTFTFIFALGLWMFKTKREAPDWVAFILMLIGVVGISIDGGIVLKQVFGL
jgi:peptidoglycan/LPS O-acetylase OafA/YrhL